MPLDAPFEALLKDHDIPEQVINYLQGIGMQKMDDLAVHLDSRSEVQNTRPRPRPQGLRIGQLPPQAGLADRQRRVREEAHQGEAGVGRGGDRLPPAT